MNTAEASIIICLAQVPRPLEAKVRNMIPSASIQHELGEDAELVAAPDCKSGSLRGHVGSNPTRSTKQWGRGHNGMMPDCLSGVSGFDPRLPRQN